MGNVRNGLAPYALAKASHATCSTCREVEAAERLRQRQSEQKFGGRFELRGKPHTSLASPEIISLIFSVH
ncbi:hypothetical protein [Nostoc sp.]|uniref:hypothetical protein n=1 Tax=Nostoc sp. TaxID=1180 RepID=UPI002FF4A134